MLVPLIPYRFVAAFLASERALVTSASALFTVSGEGGAAAGAGVDGVEHIISSPYFTGKRNKLLSV
jgi:hypothetical protein